MAGSKLPSFQFYPGDWMKDPALRAVSLAARGLWMDTLCLMFESARRGYLQHATGKPVTHEQLARMTGCSAEEASRLLQELEDSGVFSRTEHGVIFSKRMVRDELRRQTNRENGSKGGNPRLVPHDLSDNPPVNRHPNRTPNRPVNRNPTPSSSSSSSSSEEIHTPPPPTGEPPDGGGGEAMPEVARVWNSVPGVHHVRQVTTARRKTLQTRLRDPTWAGAWRDAIQRVSSSSFCRGQGSTGWVADFDWFLRPDTVTRLLEGKYDDRNSTEVDLFAGIRESRRVIDERGTPVEMPG